MEHCIGCGTELNCLDEDPNGDKSVECVRCRAEAKHDFDKEPDVVFDRLGRIVDIVPEGWRRLKEGENIRSRDRYTRDKGQTWKSVTSTGGRWNPKGHWPCIREI